MIVTDRRFGDRRIGDMPHPIPVDEQRTGERRNMEATGTIDLMRMVLETNKAFAERLEALLLRFTDIETKRGIKP